MTRKVVLALGCLALLVTFSSAAFADAITFSFTGGKSVPIVKINKSGVLLGPAKLITITDSDSNLQDNISGSVFVATGAASSYAAGVGSLDALYNSGAGIEVQVDSASCVGGTMPGVCLQGILNGNGTYVAIANGSGSFQAVFTVTYVSPYVTSFFGQPYLWLPGGSDSFTTGHNKFTSGGTTDAATLGQGGITFQTVPEPGTLALLGSGVVGLAGLIRRRN